MSVLRRLFRSDRGASLILVAGSMFMLIGAASIAVDLSALRTDRSTDQKVTDAAAAAGALALVGGAGTEACETALAYVAINSEGIGSIDTSGCAPAFAPSCDPSNAQSHTVPVAGRFEITITYPVPDTHDLMTSGLLGATPQTLVVDDGEPCDRVGVVMSATRDPSFAQVLGFGQGNTQVHTVARTHSRDPSFPLNLLVLDRTACQAISVSGGGGIIALAVVNEDGSGLEQGVIAADSDGSQCGNNEGVINMGGSNSVVRADGPEGCLNQEGTGIVGGFVSGHGCGLIMSYAPGPPGCNWPACRGGAGTNEPNPPPRRLPERFTRAPVDYRYNCWSNYQSPPTVPTSVLWASDPLTPGNGQDIPLCEEADGTNHYIYQLIQFVGQTGAPPGFQTWTTDLGYTCNPSEPEIVVPAGVDVFVNCTTFRVQNKVTFNGNVVFQGEVGPTTSGHLVVNNGASSPGFAFFRGGRLSKGGSASLTFNNTTVYMSKTSDIRLTAGSGALTWIAPPTGNFNNLALWSDSPLEHRWAGQAALQMEGVFFMPRADAVYVGGSDQNQTSAQWVANTISASGQGALVVQPAFGHVRFPLSPATVLLR